MRRGIQGFIGCVAASVTVFLGTACGSDRPNGTGPADAGPGDAAGVFSDTGTSTHGAPDTCAGAANARSYIGCDYWPTVLANNVWDLFDYAVVVANGQDSDAKVTITGPNNVNQTQTVPAGGLKKFYLPWVKSLKGAESDSCGAATGMPASVMAAGGAYHLVSSIPVSVFQFNALEYKGVGGASNKNWGSCPGNSVCADPNSPNFGATNGCFSFSNDASLLLPSSAWTGNYRVTGQAGLGNEGNGVGSYFAVTASRDGTKVTVKLPNLQNTLPGSGITGTSGALTFALDAGDVAEIVAPPGTQHDLSGALVQSNQPVQVMAGTPCSVAGDNSNQLTCDHIEESVFPAETLGKHYVVAPPTSPGGKVVGHLVRFYGNADTTNLSYAPSKPAGCPAKVNAGQVFQCDGIVATAFEVTGDHEFSVGSFMLSGQYQDGMSQVSKGDPSQSLPTAVEQYRAKYIFLAPDDYDENWIDIVVPDGASVTVDDAPVTAKPTAIANGFGVVRHKLGPGIDGAHTLAASKPVGLQVMGFGAYTSYHYPGGLDLNQIAPAPVK